MSSEAPDKLVFDASLEGLFLRGIRDVPLGLREELKGIGIDLGKKLPPAVSREVWYRALGATARHIFPELERGEAMRQIGVVLMKGVQETFFGRTMAPIVRLLGPRRLIERVPRNMRSSNNFAIGTLTALGERSLQLDVSDVGDAPEVMQGSMEEIVRWAGAKTVEVTFTFEQPPAARYLISWTE